MKKRYLLLAMAGVLALSMGMTACKEKEPTIEDKEIFEEELQPLEEGELEDMENVNQGDEEMSVLDEEELEALGEIQEDSKEEENTENQLDEDGIYTEKQDVAVYLHTYGHLPSNYITLQEAKDLGYRESEDNLGEIAKDKAIGGDVYENTDGMFPKEEGRTYRQCDVNVKDGKRGEERLIYSNDGLIFYSGDLFETYEQVY